jgi:ElaB/YqjD/DUF883 family membrane-anchored ribosome-binding protein
MASTPEQQTKLPIRSAEVAEVEDDIARTRDRVSRSVMALRQAVADQTDWREWVRRRPGLFLGAAFAAGLLLGSRGGGRRTRI